MTGDSGHGWKGWIRAGCDWKPRGYWGSQRGEKVAELGLRKGQFIDTYDGNFFCRILSALICSFHIHNFTPMLPASQGLIFEMTEIIILNQTEKQQMVLLIKHPCNPRITSLVAQTVKHLPTMWETWVRSLGQEYPLEKETATHSSTLAWKIPWTEEPGRLQSTGSQRVGHDWLTSLSLLLSWP